jgi:transcriptional regulator with XRE-family HTH domain
MNREHSSGKSFQSLGGRLKAAREKRRESLGEVSGAVEIDIDTLELIEQGKQRPTEEVLMLLISHFGIADDEATSLWELANYDGQLTTTGMAYEDNNQLNQTAFALPMDIRIVYTDIVNVMVNNYGVVMNFMQNSGPNNQPLAVARVGMSKEHARSVLEVLQKTLEQSEVTQQPKALPSPHTKKQKTDK